MRTRRAVRPLRSACVTSFERPSRKWPAAVAILVFALGLWVGRANVPWLIAGAFGGYGQSDSSNSPYATAADFARYAMKLRNEGLLKVEPIVQILRDFRAPWKQNIVTTVFWVGEPAGPNNPVSNDKSSWDLNWTVSYGGFDPPEISNRRNYIPVAFIPRQNPFYVALPYNDVTHGQFKPEAPLIIPWFKGAYTSPGQSVCKDHWIAIRKGNRICYAQWEDCGPFRTDHFQYVFGNERPKPNANDGAGLDVSPAVRDYLGLQPTDATDWQFVGVRDVPQGPWRSYGDNNPFVTAHRRVEGQLVKAQGARSEETRAKSLQ
jgi:hypothetical protein